MGKFTKTGWSAEFRRLNPELTGQTSQPRANSGLDKPKSPLPAPKSGLSAVFEGLWEAAKGPELKQEWRFHQRRQWRFDYALPKKRFAIELEGITKQCGRHQRKAGFEADAEKYLAAFIEGWTVVRLTRKLLTEENILHILIVLGGMEEF